MTSLAALPGSSRVACCAVSRSFKGHRVNNIHPTKSPAAHIQPMRSPYCQVPGMETATPTATPNARALHSRTLAAAPRPATPSTLDAAAEPRRGLRPRVFDMGHTLIETHLMEAQLGMK